MIVAAYKPNTNTNGVRDRIKLDIDRLVYCSENPEDFYNKLKERGYLIKGGKYIAVKPTFAERFVRLKTLGEAYLPKNLEKRIAQRDKFPNSVREKFKNANLIEKKFQVTVLDMIVEVKGFRLIPRKVEPNKIYTFKNDAEINYLSEQLCTIQDFNFSAGEQIYAKAEELKAANDTQQLKRVSELIRAYEKIVEGHYIDNLIKAQMEQSKSLQRTIKNSR